MCKEESKDDQRWLLLVSWYEPFLAFPVHISLCIVSFIMYHYVANVETSSKGF